MMRKLILGSIYTTAALMLLSGCGGYDVEGGEQEYDHTRLYKLPYEQGTSHDLYQGYNGSISHTNQYALDILMTLNTPILAARDGVVEDVVDNFSGACPLTKNCSNNYVNIRHDDGTLGRYLHIQTSGACVKKNDLIKQGDAIALSGSVGISATPHLHFQVLSANPSNLLPKDKPSFVGVNNAGTGFPVAGVAYYSTNKKMTDYCKTP